MTRRWNGFCYNDTIPLHSLYNFAFDFYNSTVQQNLSQCVGLFETSSVTFSYNKCYKIHTCYHTEKFWDFNMGIPRISLIRVMVDYSFIFPTKIHVQCTPNYITLAGIVFIICFMIYWWIWLQRNHLTSGIS